MCGGVHPPGEVVGSDHGCQLVGCVDGDSDVVGVGKSAGRQNVALRQSTEQTTERTIKLD